MGSPCNTFANEPDPLGALGPTGTALKIPAPADCTRPLSSGAISGPEVDKGEGSQFDARKCGGGEVRVRQSRLRDAANTEFDLRGFIYLVRVSATGVGAPIKLQIYDPAHVPTGLRCQERPTPLTATPSPSGVINSNNWNDYANTDALTRYRSTRPPVPTRSAPATTSARASTSARRTTRRSRPSACARRSTP